MKTQSRLAKEGMGDWAELALCLVVGLMTIGAAPPVRGQQPAVMQQGKVDLVLRETEKIHQSADKLQKVQESFDADAKALQAREAELRTQAVDGARSLAERRTAAARALEKKKDLALRARQHAAAAADSYQTMLTSLDSILGVTEKDPFFRGEATTAEQTVLERLSASVAADRNLYQAIQQAVNGGQVSAQVAQRYANGKRLANSAADAMEARRRKMKQVGFNENLSTLREQVLQSLTQYTALRDVADAQLEGIVQVATLNGVVLAGEKVSQALSGVVSVQDPLGNKIFEPGSEYDYVIGVDESMQGTPTGPVTAQNILSREVFEEGPRSMKKETP